MIRFGRVLSSRFLEAVSLLGLARSLCLRIHPDARRAKAQRAGFYRTVWKDAAVALGASVRELDGDVIEIRRAERRTRVFRNYTPLDDPITLRVAGNKPLVLQLMADAGLPIVEHRLFYLRTIQDALAFLAEAGGPCVVEPARGTGAGQGVTTGITKRLQLLLAAAGSGIMPWGALLVEREVEGANYRLLFLDGELLDAVRRLPPSVTGDGTSTVTQLIRTANRCRLEQGYQLAQTVLQVDRDMRRTLARQNLHMAAVPAAGVRVALKTAINSNTADENEPVTGELCQAVVDAAAKAAAVVGARLAGVDIITPDPSRPLEDVNGVILEVNTTPGFHFHYHRKGEGIPVAERVLESVFASPARFGESRETRS